MLRRIKLDRGTDLHVVFDLDRRAVEKDAVIIDEDIAPKTNIIAVVACKERHDGRSVADRPHELAQ